MLGIIKELYARYIDDVVTALNTINKGWDYKSTKGKMVFTKEMEKSDTRSEEERTAEVLVKIANSLHKNIQFTWDVPGRNPDKRKPVLHLAVWVGEIEGVQTIMHSFYKNKVASPYTILKRSVLSYKIKRNTLLQEALRRLGNILPSLPWEESRVHLTKYSNMLRLSGYSDKEWLHNIRGATMWHRQMMDEVRSGKKDISTGTGTRSWRQKTSREVCLELHGSSAKKQGL